MSSSSILSKSSRREVLKGILAGAVASTPVTAAANATPSFADAATYKAPTYEELTRYYAFLWGEFSDLSTEMCVEMHDSYTAHRNGDIAALSGRLTAPPSTRANIVLQSIGADCETLVYVPTFPSGKRGQSAEERARYHYAEFAKAMNEATSEANGWLIMAGNRRPHGKVHSGAWANVKTIHYEASADPRFPGLLIERHRDIEGVA